MRPSDLCMLFHAKLSSVLVTLYPRLIVSAVNYFNVNVLYKCLWMIISEMNRNVDKHDNPDRCMKSYMIPVIIMP